MKFTTQVTVEADTIEEAEQVITERIQHEEELGFNYIVDSGPVEIHEDNWWLDDEPEHMATPVVIDKKVVAFVHPRDQKDPGGASPERVTMAQVGVFVSEIDGVDVVQIDTVEGRDYRVVLNDGDPIYEGNPEVDAVMPEPVKIDPTMAARQMAHYAALTKVVEEISEITGNGPIGECFESGGGVAYAVWNVDGFGPHGALLTGILSHSVEDTEFHIAAFQGLHTITAEQVNRIDTLHDELYPPKMRPEPEAAPAPTRLPLGARVPNFGVLPPAAQEAIGGLDAVVNPDSWSCGAWQAGGIVEYLATRNSGWGGDATVISVLLDMMGDDLTVTTRELINGTWEEGYSA